MVTSISSASIATSILTSANASSGSTGGFDYSALYPSSSSSGSAYDAGSVDVAYKLAQKNETQQLAAAAKDPITKKNIAHYTAVVKKAKTINDVLNDPVAREVFLKANGLGGQVDAVGLARQVFASDPTSQSSTAYKMGQINGNWYQAAKTYNFPANGIAQLQSATGIATMTNNYIAEKRLDTLDQQLPGLGTALLFKKNASTLNTALKILGDPVGRSVVTTALGLPQQIATQSLEAQEKAITTKFDPKTLATPSNVDRMILRFLVQNNVGTTSSNQGSVLA